mmetsp:Transcript_10452/g.23096  ORF Transcript_10452/g.23096 Transcript_10452/m.23096 type:complete len:331 (+) Transcript_10452:5822-6814(+)
MLRVVTRSLKKAVILKNPSKSFSLLASRRPRTRITRPIRRTVLTSDKDDDQAQSDAQPSSEPAKTDPVPVDPIPIDCGKVPTKEDTDEDSYFDSIQGPPDDEQDCPKKIFKPDDALEHESYYASVADDSDNEGPAKSTGKESSKLCESLDTIPGVPETEGMTIEDARTRFGRQVYDPKLKNPIIPFIDHVIPDGETQLQALLDCVGVPTRAIQSMVGALLSFGINNFYDFVKSDHKLYDALFTSWGREKEGRNPKTMYICKVEFVNVWLNAMQTRRYRAEQLTWGTFVTSLHSSTTSSKLRSRTGITSVAISWRTARALPITRMNWIEAS